MKTWFSIAAQASDAPAEITIYDAIGAWNVSAVDFLAQLKSIDAKEITLSINSPGGSVFDGLAIYNGLRNHPASITVRVMGVAASIASVIAMAGDKIVMPENTFLMVHSPLNCVMGNAGEMRDMADMLDKVESSLIATYVARTGRDAAEIKGLLDAETLMTAAEAVALGFADEMEPALTISASFDMDNLPEAVRNIFASVNHVTDPIVVIPEPVLPDEPTFASQVAALALASGFEAHVFALDTTITTLTQAKAAVAQAKEVRDLCMIAHMPELIAQLVAEKCTAHVASTRLTSLLADAADKLITDNTQTDPQKPVDIVPSTALKTAAVWAARHTTSRN